MKIQRTTESESKPLLHRYYVVFTAHGCIIKQRAQVYAASPNDAITKLSGQKAKMGIKVDRVKEVAR